MSKLNYHSLASLLAAAEAEGRRLSALIIEDQAEELAQTSEAVFAEMAVRYQVMEEGIEPGTAPELKSTSGLTGGNACKLKKAIEENRTITGSLMSGALMRAFAISELNASMGRIVASPTAGSCGILPAALLTMEAEGLATRTACIQSMFTAAAIGMVIAENASVSGAQGGCQAECGSASAMAAGAIVELMGGSPTQIGHAVAIALKNILGLVCDPVAGLVEVPCVKRNASGVASAFVAAEIALAGIASVIPADEVIVAMRQVGDSMSAALKETAEGGLAATPTGRRLFAQIFGENADSSSPAKTIAAGCAGCRACRS